MQQTRVVRRGQHQWTVPTPTPAIDQFWEEFSDVDDPVMGAVAAVVERHADPGKVLIDIGAWIGPVTLIGSVGYGSVVAVEPNPVAFQILNRTITFHENANLGKRIAPFQFAIERDDGPVKMLPAVDFYPLAGLETEATVISQAISMDRFMTLVDLINKPIGLIKADLGTLHTLRRAAGSLIDTAMSHGCPLVMSVSSTHYMAYEFETLAGLAEGFVCDKEWTVSTSGDDWSKLIEVCPL